MKESGYGRLESTCNPDTVSDGRGGIFTWVPEEPIEKYRMIHCNPVTKVREEHTSKSKEYLLITGGSGAIVFKEPSRDREVVPLSKGDCIYASPGIAHTVVPITPLSAVAMLTKKWDDCEEPITKVTITGNSGEE